VDLNPTAGNVLPEPRLLPSVTRWVAIVVLTALVVRLILRRGPVSLHLPMTVYSNSHPAQKAVEPYLQFLSTISTELPSGATVGVLTLPPKEIDPFMAYLISIGQLPNQAVVILSRETDIPMKVPGAGYVASYGAPLTLPGPRLVRRLPGGFLYWTGR
jgi:hypothetical protein